ncbi:formylmethanofuran dehydrogenase subunit E family protein, partial [Candidatus Bipolaricaulota bacterium]|nr:formylmethanofuran dehydrogenase subunit E family protein [Candidatus Bipolaricaulota bacterium]
MPTTPFKEVAQFHGHVCPGLAIGYRMTLAALACLSEHRAEDEEIVAIIENDACGVDALQYLSGCTFGKGNLIFDDYGKSVYTLYSRTTGEGVRVVWRDPQVPAEIAED